MKIVGQIKGKFKFLKSKIEHLYKKYPYQKIMEENKSLLDEMNFHRLKKYFIVNPNIPNKCKIAYLPLNTNTYVFTYRYVLNNDEIIGLVDDYQKVELHEVFLPQKYINDSLDINKWHILEKARNNNNLKDVVKTFNQQRY